MKLEVGKSYRTRAGEKITIINVDDDRNYPFKGDNKNCYKENGRVWRYHEDEIDLIAPWEDEPAVRPIVHGNFQIANTALKFKEGDLVTVKLTNEGASNLNLQGGKLSIRYIGKNPCISHTPAPEPEFDWSTAKAGMAFKMGDDIFWYVAKDITRKDYAIFTDSEEWINFDCYFLGNFKRAPEHDMEVK